MTDETEIDPTAPLSTPETLGVLYPYDDGIDEEEGIVDDSYQEVETYYRPLENILIDPDLRYLRIIGDDPVGFVEIRVPLALLEANGFRHTGETCEVIRRDVPEHMKERFDAAEAEGDEAPEADQAPSAAGE